MRRDGIVSRIVRITLVSLVFLAMFGVVLSSHAVEADGSDLPSNIRVGRVMPNEIKNCVSVDVVDINAHSGGEALATNSVSYIVFATRIGLVGSRTANGHVIQIRDHFAALPSTKVLCSNGGHEFEVRITYKGKSIVAPIWDVGPWNTKDDYWNPSEQREMWNDLPQGIPEAQAAYLNGYNGGKNQYGRTVTNPAGIDLADGTFWDDLGMTDNDWVTVEFLWVPAVSVKDSSPYFMKGSNSGHPEYWHTYTYDGTPEGDYNGHTYIWTYVGGMPGNPLEPDCWAEFRPYLSQAGKYEVYACFYADPRNSRKVPYTVYYAGGSIKVIVDQYAPDYFTWRKVKLGTWDFATGADTRVLVTDATGEPYDGTTTLNVDTIEFVLISNKPPNQPTSLSQLRSDGITVIPEGGITPEDTVVFKGTVSDPDGDQVRLEIELRQISEAFTGEPTLETISVFVPSGTQVTITRYGLVNADYHWQYRAKDSKGAVSNWVEFGTPGNIDFTVMKDETPPNDWIDFSPTGWVRDQTPDCSIKAKDTESGLDVSTAEYRYSTNGGSSWSSWGSASCTGSDGTTSYQTITASNVPFYKDSKDENKIQFRIKDIVGNTGTSNIYTVKIDTTPPNTPSISESHCSPDWTTHNSPYFTWGDPGDAGSGISFYEGNVNDGAPFTLSSPYHPTWNDGIHTFKVRAVDGVGLRSGWSNVITVKIDTTPPAGSISINAGAAYTTSTSVTLTLSAVDGSGSGVVYMCFSNDGTSWTSWEYYATSKPWTLTSGDGTKTVYVKYKDYVGLESPAAYDAIILDTAQPTGSISINAGATYTTSVSVTLTLTYSDATSGVGQVRYSNDGIWDTEPWETPSPTKAWTLTSGDGTKTVYYQVKDNAGLVSPTYSDTIILDTTPPTGSIIIAGGATYTTTTTVTLTFSATDVTSGVAQMRLSNDGVFDTEPWEAYATSKSWTLPTGDGIKTVYVQFKDNAGLISPSYSDTIILDTTAPTIIDHTPTGIDVPVTTTITVTFSEALDKASAQSAFSISPSVSGSFSWSGNTMMFSPTSILAYGTTYYVTIDIQAEDLAGNPLQAPHTWQFTTSQAANAYLVVRSSTNKIIYRIYDSSSDSWGGWKTLPGATCDAPAAAVYEDELHIVVRSLNGKALFHGYVDLAKDEFSGWKQISGSTPSPPTLATNGTALILVIRATNNRIQYRFYDFTSRSWGSWNVIPKGTTCDGPTAAMLGNDLHIVVRGYSSTNVNVNYTLWHTIVRPSFGVVRGWIKISGTTTPSKPALAANQTTNNLYLVVRTSTNRIHYNTYDAKNDSWGSWIPLPKGSTCDGPGATVCGNKLHIVVRSLNGLSLFHGYVNLSTGKFEFSGWKQISGSTPSPPTLAG